MSFVIYSTVQLHSCFTNSHLTSPSSPQSSLFFFCLLHTLLTIFFFSPSHHMPKPSITLHSTLPTAPSSQQQHLLWCYTTYISHSHHLQHVFLYHAHFSYHALLMALLFLTTTFLISRGIEFYSTSFPKPYIFSYTHTTSLPPLPASLPLFSRSLGLSLNNYHHHQHFTLIDINLQNQFIIPHPLSPSPPLCPVL